MSDIILNGIVIVVEDYDGAEADTLLEIDWFPSFNKMGVGLLDPRGRLIL